MKLTFEERLQLPMTDLQRELFEAQMTPRRKSFGVAIALACALGGAGAHRWYLGDYGLGVAFLVALVACVSLSTSLALPWLLVVPGLAALVDLAFVSSTIDQRNDAAASEIATRILGVAGIASIAPAPTDAVTGPPETTASPFDPRTLLLLGAILAVWFAVVLLLPDRSREPSSRVVSSTAPVDAPLVWSGTAGEERQTDVFTRHAANWQITWEARAKFAVLGCQMRVTVYAQDAAGNFQYDDSHASAPTLSTTETMTGGSWVHKAGTFYLQLAPGGCDAWTVRAQ